MSCFLIVFGTAYFEKEAARSSGITEKRLAILEGDVEFNIKSVDASRRRMIIFDIENLGKALYTSYIFPFLEAGFILFISMVGAMVVTLDSDTANKTMVKKQDPIDQALKMNKNTVFFSLQNITKNTTKLQADIYIKLWKHAAQQKKIKS